MTTTVTNQFEVVLAELEDLGLTRADIYEAWAQGTWDSISLGQEFNTLVDLADKDGIDLLQRYGIAEDALR